MPAGYIISLHRSTNIWPSPHVFLFELSNLIKKADLATVTNSYATVTLFVEQMLGCPVQRIVIICWKNKLENNFPNSWWSAAKKNSISYAKFALKVRILVVLLINSGHFHRQKWLEFCRNYWKLAKQISTTKPLHSEKKLRATKKTFFLLTTKRQYLQNPSNNTNYNNSNTKKASQTVKHYNNNTTINKGSRRHSQNLKLIENYSCKTSLSFYKIWRPKIFIYLNSLELFQILITATSQATEHTGTVSVTGPSALNLG